MDDLILVFDQGTTGSQAAFYGAETLDLLCTSKVDYQQHYPQPGWVEHNAEDIWESSLKALERSKATLKLSDDELRSRLICIGITNQRETTVPWDRRSGKPVANALVWQDRRTAEMCKHLRADPRAHDLKARTGLVLDPYFSATKMRWLLENVDAVQELRAHNALALGTVDAFLIFRLTGGAGFFTDHTNASRSLLYGLTTGDYDPALLTLFGVPRESLPQIVPSIGVLGHTHGVPGLPDGIPISGVMGDQQAALFGQDCEQAGEAKITFGTGSFALLNIGATSGELVDGILTSVALHDGTKRTFAREGSSFIAAAAIKYLRDIFGWFSDSALSEALACQDPADREVVFVPAFAGLGAPYWNPNARAALIGLTQGTTRSQITRAVLESIALQNVQLIELMRHQTPLTIQRVGVDGGASRNNYLMQFQSDMLGVSVQRPLNSETTSRGAAKAALRGVQPQRVLPLAKPDRTFEPQMEGCARSEIYSRWKRAADSVDKFYRQQE